MEKNDIVGTTVGKIYVKSYIGGKNQLYNCICTCGSEFVTYKKSILDRTTDCGCGAVTGVHKKRLNVGDIYEGCEILDVGLIYGNQTLYTFRCKCGGIARRVHSEFLKRPLCKDCVKNERAAAWIRNLRDEYVGKTVNGILITDIIGTDAHKCTKVYAICPVCGRKFETYLQQIKKGKGSCGICNRKCLEPGRDIVKEAAVAGSSVVCISPDRALNRNSTTGHTGVSFDKKAGKYRAYINFRRKQYDLGRFERIEDAVAARKEAERKIYGPFLDWYAENYPGQWKKINRKKGQDG